MAWAKEIFMYDTGKETWNEVIDEYGAPIVPTLRTFASLLKKEVRASDKRKKIMRPVSYMIWLKKITSKVK